MINGEFQREALQEGQYSRAYQSLDQETQDAKALRSTVVSGGLVHLEEQYVLNFYAVCVLVITDEHPRFMKHVERTLLARPTEANLGGVPSTQNKIRAYINVKYSKMGQWTNTNLELANNQPIWARIYLLLRAGHSEEALAFATENEHQLQKLEKGFLAYFKAWLDSPDKRYVGLSLLPAASS